MTLAEYIRWATSTDHYLESPYHADINAWSWQELPAVKLPQLDIPELAKGSEGYSSYRTTKLQRWAELTWRDLSHIKCSVQVQQPGEVCHPHLDLLGEYLQQVAEQHPTLLEQPHSLHNPTVDCRRMFVAVEDQKPGQRFVINGKDWQWRQGDCISMNPWTALHHTANTGSHSRALIKITAVKL